MVTHVLWWGGEEKIMHCLSIGAGRRLLALSVVCACSLFSFSIAGAAVLLNDTWADGNRSSTSLPTDSPTWVGVSTSDGGAGVTVTPGKLANGIGTTSRKNWTYFTSDLSAP